MKQQKINDLSLELKYLNGDGEFKLPSFRGVSLTDESQLQLDIVLEEAEKVPPKIRRESDASQIKAVVLKLRSARNSVEAMVFSEKEPIRAIMKQIDLSVTDYLTKYNEHIKNYVDELTRWETQKRDGAKKEETKLLEKKVEVEKRIDIAKTPQEKAKIAQQLVALENAAQDVAPKTTPGLALRSHWVGQLIDAVAILKSRQWGHLVEVSLDQKEINAVCREVEERGGTVNPNMIPGVKLVRKTWSAVMGG